jgi:PhzF family phenazine biosynthesis protein
VITYYGVDAFTARPFRGNPAAVCLLDEPLGAEWMQRIAAELAQPTTAFLYADEEHLTLRWFTPTTELPLCGHATLAAAHVLYETGRDRTEPLSFRIPVGTLPVRAEGSRIWLDLTSVPVTAAEPVPEVLAALGADPDVVEGFGGNDSDFVVLLDSPAAVERLSPDAARVRALPVNRVIVTAAGGDGADFTSRVFTPALGVDEDAVTGSAHAVLGPWWAARLGRTRFDAVQASSRRGRLAVLVDGARTHVGGTAVTVAKGFLLRPP